jgi:toxin YoeB
MNNFFLLNEAVDLSDYNQFKEGMLELNAIERENNDIFLKHESIWNLNVIPLLYYGTFGQEEQVISKFIEQLKPLNNNYISTSEEFDDLYPGELNAFLGIVFDNTSIKPEKQVMNTTGFHRTKYHYYSNFQCNGDTNKMKDCLEQLYPNYKFSDKAVEDITHWNQMNFQLSLRIHELLADIIDNPFQGGRGKTEVLKNRKEASKRINEEHRLTYYLENNIIYVLSCKGHYE